MPWRRVCPPRACRRTLWAGDRLLPRTRREHARVRPRDRHDGDERNRRPFDPAGGRRRLRLQNPQNRSRVGRLFRGRGRQQRGLPRRPQHGRHLELARPLYLRKQPIRHRGPLQLFQRKPQRGRPCSQLRPDRGRGRRQRRHGGLRDNPRGSRAGPLGLRTDPDRVQNLSDAAARRGNGGLRLPDAGRSRRLEGPLPDRPVSLDTVERGTGHGRRTGRHRRRGGRRRPRGDRFRRFEPLAERELGCRSCVLRGAGKPRSRHAQLNPSERTATTTAGGKVGPRSDLDAGDPRSARLRDGTEPGDLRDGGGDRQTGGQLPHDFRTV